MRRYVRVIIQMIAEVSESEVKQDLVDALCDSILDAGEVNIVKLEIKDEVQVNKRGHAVPWKE